MNRNITFYAITLWFYCILSLSILIGANEYAFSAEESKLPRFVSLRADKVNMRTGPGFNYPIDWVYMRKQLPVEIIAEFETWRKVRDWQGTQGWIHQSMLSGKRTLLITGDVRNLRRKDDSKSVTRVRAEPGVIGRLLGCPKQNGWCLVEIAGFEGWLRHVDFWGVYKSEVFD